MAKAKFFLPENRNAQVDEANALPSDIYFPANINRTESRTTTPNNPGTFTTDDNISLNAETTARLLLSALVSADLMASA